MVLRGEKIKLRPAILSERRLIYAWLAKSDLTPAFMGKPNYPDSRIPTLKEFYQDYKPSFFHSSGNKTGRNYMIIANNIRVGTVGYDWFDDKKRRVVLDVWMRAEKYCGKGYGTDALTTICRFLHKRYGIRDFYISPSLRNTRAMAAYRKAGFKPIRMSRHVAKKEFGVDIYDYSDNIVMRKTLEEEGQE